MRTENRLKDFMNAPTREEIQEITGLNDDDFAIAEAMCDLMCGGFEDEVVEDSSQDYN